ncbi:MULTISPECIES: response regulator transcription factor [Acinetobacter]|uniref:Response regulator transcription factor n=1 Tax=Acinetobacter faecalis TaxID=2665161 RepID=A0AB35UX76_9GAMM|nr:MULTISPECIES: response regulator transcription factor [Acinetobacter]MDY6458301.1 response regulator transcription factor [Acinetobacter faecalis]MDY6487015.1 response regulator transcription factor [Acinetobacter faecalis]MDY6510753.1 response regulator transcription factor [Acinetobacter faecalis]MDY6530568.1 response regulator transcription factor [Acinetobacter faecalis]MDY6549171.1 response regulator transcription factor [Acinetobacter faecalis]
MSKHFILMVEDHHELASTLCEFLEEHDFVVDHARNLDAARNLLKQRPYHMLLLDINLPDGSGYDLCEWLRNQESMDIPVLMLTARDTLDDKLKGFKSGTDDYLVKPFDFNELVMRVKALIKRSLGEVSNRELRISDLILDPGRQYVSRAGQAIELPPIQFKLLKLLVRNAPNVLTKQEIMMELWGDEEPESDALRSHIYNLRKMIDKPFEQKLIQTVSGVGLKISTET